MTKWQAILWVDGVQKEVHNFELEYSQKGWYRSVTSISAFQNREGERLHKYVQKKRSYNLPGKRCHVKFGYDIEADEKMRNNVKGLLGKNWQDPFYSLPQFHHDSVWDFYKAIGYDYKKKRYVDDR